MIEKIIQKYKFKGVEIQVCQQNEKQIQEIKQEQVQLLLYNLNDKMNRIIIYEDFGSCFYHSVVEFKIGVKNQSQFGYIKYQPNDNRNKEELISLFKQQDYEMQLRDMKCVRYIIIPNEIGLGFNQEGITFRSQIEDIMNNLEIDQNQKMNQLNIIRLSIKQMEDYQMIILLDRQLLQSILLKQSDVKIKIEIMKIMIQIIFKVREVKQLQTKYQKILIQGQEGQQLKQQMKLMIQEIQIKQCQQCSDNSQYDIYCIILFLLIVEEDDNDDGQIMNKIVNVIVRCVDQLIFKIQQVGYEDYSFRVLIELIKIILHTINIFTMNLKRSKQNLGLGICKFKTYRAVRKLMHMCCNQQGDLNICERETLITKGKCKSDIRMFEISQLAYEAMNGLMRLQHKQIRSYLIDKDEDIINHTIKNLELPSLLINQGKYIKAQMKLMKQFVSQGKEIMIQKLNVNFVQILNEQSLKVMKILQYIVNPEERSLYIKIQSYIIEIQSQILKLKNSHQYIRIMESYIKIVITNIGLGGGGNKIESRRMQGQNMLRYYELIRYYEKIRFYRNTKKHWKKLNEMIELEGANEEMDSQQLLYSYMDFNLWFDETIQDDLVDLGQ